MRGSLDDPPIIIRQSRSKLFLVGCLCAAFAIFVGLLLFNGKAGSLIWGWLGLLLFGGGALIFAFLTIFPGSLTLDKSGLIARISGRTTSYKWDDFVEFMVWSPRWPARQVGCVLAENRRQRNALLRLSGGLGSFGGQWEMAPQNVVDLLNQARRRWGSPA